MRLVTGSQVSDAEILQKLDKVRQGLSPKTSGRNGGLLTPSFQPCETHFTVVTSRTVKQRMCVVSATKLVTSYSNDRK